MEEKKVPFECACGFKGYVHENLKFCPNCNKKTKIIKYKISRSLNNKEKIIE